MRLFYYLYQIKWKLLATVGIQSQFMQENGKITILLMNINNIIYMIY